LNVKVLLVLALSKVYYIDYPVGFISLVCLIQPTKIVDSVNCCKISRRASQVRQDRSKIQPAKTKIRHLETWKTIDIVNTFCGCSFIS